MVADRKTYARIQTAAAESSTEVGADFRRADVADDAEGRVVEGVAVLVELAVGFLQVLVLVLLLVLPREGAALLDVDEAAVALGAFGGGADHLH